MTDFDEQRPRIASSAADTVISPRIRTPPPSTPAPAGAASPNAPTASTLTREDTVGVGSVLNGKYRLEKQIGAGGMGIVYLARDLEHERVAQEEQVVAIKVLRSEYRGQQDLVRALFEEVRRAQTLSGPNIVTVFNCQYSGTDVYMTMQYLEGMTLDRLIDQDFARGMPWNRARTIIEGVGAGLANAHDHGIIHCDLKPANVFITLGGTAKILDFGIARAARARRQGQELRGLTREYSSPEAIRAWEDQQRGGSVDDYRPSERDDIFSLGCLSYELLSGRRPFELEDAEQARLHQRPYRPLPSLSHRQNQTLAKALALDPSARWTRVEDFLGGLEGSGIPVVAYRKILPAVAVIVTVATLAYFLTKSRTGTEPPTLASSAPTQGRTPVAPDTRNGSARVFARDLFQRLGIDNAPLSADGRMPADAVLTLLQTSPRRVQLGSTSADLQAALNLCQAHAKGCKMEWYADELIRTPVLGPFKLDVAPTTIGDFREFVDATGYRTVAEHQGFAYAVVDNVLSEVANGSWQNGVNQRHIEAGWPVVGVAFDDAVRYCQWRGKRLPTEDEWEYAARGPERRIFPWGDDPARALSLSQSHVPTPVDDAPLEGLENAYRGLAGTVWQWVDTADGTRRILKGGSWSDRNPANLRAAAHRTEQPERADSESGFRCAESTVAWPDATDWYKQIESTT